MSSETCEKLGGDAAAAAEKFGTVRCEGVRSFAFVLPFANCDCSTYFDGRIASKRFGAGIEKVQKSAGYRTSRLELAEGTGDFETWPVGQRGLDRNSEAHVKFRGCKLRKSFRKSARFEPNLACWEAVKEQFRRPIGAKLTEKAMTSGE